MLKEKRVEKQEENIEGDELMKVESIIKHGMTLDDERKKVQKIIYIITPFYEAVMKV